ncbi:GH3 auxin-responsive promoter family protein [soil metagenome]
MSPVRSLINTFTAAVMRRRLAAMQLYMADPAGTQQRQLNELVEAAKDTEWGKQYGYRGIRNSSQYKAQVPVQGYEGFKPWIERGMAGTQNLLWPERIQWFAKSSGTTSDKSKFIPVSPAALEHCHFKGGRDTMSIYCNQYPETKLFSGKALVMGGSHKWNDKDSGTRYGDVSAVMLENMPFFADLFRTPDRSIALMDEWESKIERMAKATINEPVTQIAGVPSWTLVLIRKIFEITGKTDLRDVWPNLELFVHGGVSFAPYRKQYQQIIPHSEMHYLETYNASEGFFAIQDEAGRDDMLLLLDNGVYYEFMPLEEADKEHPKTLEIDEVKIGGLYALIISTNSGLWRYLLGDTVRVTSLKPFRIQVAGRLKHYINAFGEEVVVDNTDRALEKACAESGAQVRDYTACPAFTGNGQGYHEWLVEFVKAPQELEAFTHSLDKHLQQLNSDYEAKRYKDMVLQPIRLHAVPSNTFYNWLRSKGKLGGQHKVPRLSNERTYLDEIMKGIEQ